LKLKFRQFVGSRGARGEFIPGGDAIYVNENYFLREYDGVLLRSKSALTDITSTVIHEGVHFLGGGEIAAHRAQGHFLARALKANPKLSLDPVSHLVAQMASHDTLIPLAKTVLRKGYGVKGHPISVRDLQPVHEVLDHWGGIEGILGIKQTDIRQLKQALPQSLPL
jgi:hypothetical protein